MPHFIVTIRGGGAAEWSARIEAKNRTHAKSKGLSEMRRGNDYLRILAEDGSAASLVITVEPSSPSSWTGFRTVKKLPSSD
jgi:hypothetical protein